MKKYFWIIPALILALSACRDNQKAVTPETALGAYINSADDTYKWEIREEFSSDGLQTAILKLTSQKWREIVWNHQLTVISPAGTPSDGALLFITGGSNRNGEPKWHSRNNEDFKMFSMIAAKNNAVVAILSQVPNQPLYDDLTEDALISFTLHNFKNDRDFTWPLLFPMTKSAIKAMDAVQEFSEQKLNHKIRGFVVSGASKRGWTTWLTGSQDKRVLAIAPMVIDVLNMPVNVPYQKEAWGDYSEEIMDYVRLGIAQDLESQEGRDLATMIDPYSYRASLTMPKLIIIGTNDEYWPVDAVKKYFSDLPGEKYIHYEPNTGHGLGDGVNVAKSLSAFFNITINKKSHPVCEWQVENDGERTALVVRASPELIRAGLWICDSPDRDFRDNRFIEKNIEYENPGSVKVTVDNPPAGFRAFYVELVYPDPVEGTYSRSTRMFVADSGELFLD
ncbi:MAG TPA: PhoPQ-activated protein PqaA family protein [Bacteroidales bacterium]|jgi:PhoPQ-activated pathogenicity-related protein|nr:PhoPQ-activated protein PqaA family protein [Bacteroidales bacterium]HQH24436.1 PhoPQ-activated protein PqaA family protein [Bacteroidales bacterium]HQJ81431.1 PhoPQ-activated protein PqaA family protein [Bacteroidales bacterium]